MSDTVLTHKQVVRARRAYSHEPRWEAEYAVRGQQIGFDRCTNRAQRRLRAQLGLRLLNTSQAPRHLIESNDHRLPAWRDYYGLMPNQPVFSPRHDDFAILTDIPGHLVKKLATFAGIRLHAIDQDQNALVLRHLPTGGVVSFRYNPPGSPRFPRPCHWAVLAGNLHQLETAPDLVEKEVDALQALPPITDAAEQLLAALVSRLWLSSRAEQWAVGGLIYDPMNRARPQTDSFDFTYCWGYGDDWVVRWGGTFAVPPEDVARALTHPIAGLEGARACHDGNERCRVMLGDTVLRLERHFPAARWALEFGGAA